MSLETIGKYRVIRKLGEGGMGAVYEAMDDTIQHRVAIKVLHPQFASDPEVAQRFFNEARAVNIVDHPGVVQVTEYARLPDATAYLVMEFLRGESLQARLQRAAGPLPGRETLRLLRQLAAALAEAHDKGIIHREVLMIDSDCLRSCGKSLQRRRQGYDKLQTV